MYKGVGHQKRRLRKEEERNKETGGKIILSLGVLVFVIWNEERLNRKINYKENNQFSIWHSTWLSFSIDKI